MKNVGLNMDKADKNGLMEPSTKGAGAKIKFRAMVNLYMRIKTNTKVNSMQIELMDLADMFKSVVKRMMGTGQMISHMARENSY